MPGTIGLPNVQKPSQVCTVQQSRISATQQVCICLFLLPIFA